jgi:hypothetical protein
MALMATTNMMVPYWPATPVTRHVSDVADTHVGDVHVFSTPVAPYVIAGTDEDRPKPVPVRVTLRKSERRNEEMKSGFVPRDPPSTEKRTKE